MGSINKGLFDLRRMKVMSVIHNIKQTYTVIVLVKLTLKHNTEFINFQENKFLESSICFDRWQEMTKVVKGHTDVACFIDMTNYCFRAFILSKFPLSFINV